MNNQSTRNQLWKIDLDLNRPILVALIIVWLLYLAAPLLSNSESVLDLTGPGIPVNLFNMQVHVSIFTLLLAALLAVDSYFYIKKHEPYLARSAYAVAAIVVTVFVFASVILHETAHAIAINAFGYHVTDAGLTGWGAYVVPDVTLDKMSPIQEMIMAAAGPATNLLIAWAATWVVRIMSESLVENSIQYLAYINIRLGKINFWPIIGLDGNKVLDGFLRIFILDSTVRSILGIVAMVIFIVLLFAWPKRKTPTWEESLDDM